jgi:hypothetical protein
VSSVTPRLALYKPAGGELVNVVTDLDNNFDKLDAAIGAIPSTSTTRPASPFSGMMIRETDTERIYYHNGSTPASAGWRQIMAVNSTISSSTSTDLTARFRLTADTVDRLAIRGDGRLLWGSGAAATDTNLYRSAANLLRTDDAFQAGRIISPIQMFQAAATSILTLSTTETDIPGATVNVTTVGVNAKVMVWGTFDFKCVTQSGTIVMEGLCSIGGVTQAESANSLETATNQRHSVASFWLATLATPGTYTIKLRASQNAAGGSYQAVSPHTKMVVQVMETA